MTYYDFMHEISKDELYDRLVQHGIFSEKLPPILDAKSFLAYCKTQRIQSFEEKWYGYISYENIRNINIPRNIGIPTPMGHERLCKCLSDNWEKIVGYFKDKTELQPRIISRIHIRKMFNTEALFEMNYKNWRIDGTPEPDIYMGKKYMVHADISKCYPSIYTHAIPWALAGKVAAKADIKDDSKWYNQIDICAREAKNGETHGILIGPHTSNILSEIVLCSIDSKLSENYKNYIRNIDDYCCYTDTKEEAEQFIVDLNRELREYDLLINHKKTEIIELPVGVVESWIHKVQNQTTNFEKTKAYVDYKEIQSYIDYVIKLTSENNDNFSIIYYAIKSLADFKLTLNAQAYLTKSVVSLALLYPYIVPLLKEYIFEPYNVSDDEMAKYANMLYNRYMPKNNFEACAYAILYMIDSNGDFEDLDLDKIIASKDCLLLLMAYIYCTKKGWHSGCDKLKKHAKRIVTEGDMDQYWLFAYECLGSGSLSGDWAAMKKAGVTFLKDEYK